MNEFRAGVASFCSFSGGLDEGRLPSAAGYGFALEQVVVAFEGVVAGGAFQVEARGSFVEGFSGRELPEA